MRLRGQQIPPGYLTTGQVAKRLNINSNGVRYAFKRGKLDGFILDGVMLIKDAPDTILAAAFPLCFPKNVTSKGLLVLDRMTEDYQQKLLDRWMNDHDIRGIAERAVRETA